MWNMFHFWEGVMFIDFQFPAILSFKFQHECPWIWFCMPMLLQASPKLELHFGAPQVPSAGKIMEKCYASFQLPNQAICSFSFSSVNSSGILPPGFEFEKSPNHHSSFCFGQPRPRCQALWFFSIHWQQELTTKRWTTKIANASVKMGVIVVEKHQQKTEKPGDLASRLHFTGFIPWNVVTL